MPKRRWWILMKRDRDPRFGRGMTDWEIHRRELLHEDPGPPNGKWHMFVDGSLVSERQFKIVPGDEVEWMEGTTETIGTPMLEAMVKLNEAAQTCDVDEDWEAIRLTWLAGTHLMQAMKQALVPPPTDSETEGETGPLAYDLCREADAQFACIETVASEASRRRQDRYVFKPIVDNCIVCGRTRQLKGTESACEECWDEYRHGDEEEWPARKADR